MRKNEQIKKIKPMYLSKYEAPFMKKTGSQLRNKRKRVQAAGHSLSSPFRNAGTGQGMGGTGEKPEYGSRFAHP